MTTTTLDISSLLSIEDVCKELCITRQGFYARMAKRGSFPSHRIGRRVYFTPEVLRSALALPG